MAEHNPHKFRLERAKELNLLAEILVRNNVSPDPSPVYRAASTCREDAGDSWGYSVERLIFRLRYIKKPIPSGVYDVTLTFSMSLTGHCYEDSEIRDPLDSLEFNIVINGKHDDEGTTNPVMCSWHLDRDEPPSAGGKHEFMHPCYHFQFGGRHAKGSRLDFGAALILESPRIAHPPMDAILGVDFILTNYIKSSDLNFREESDYKNLLKKAQARMWRPYAHALAHTWHDIPDKSYWHFKLPWPQLVG